MFSFFLKLQLSMNCTHLECLYQYTSLPPISLSLFSINTLSLSYTPSLSLARAHSLSFSLLISHTPFFSSFLSFCLSLFRTHPHSHTHQSQDVDKLAAQFASYLELMHHFRKVLPGRVMDIR